MLKHLLNHTDPNSIPLVTCNKTEFTLSTSPVSSEEGNLIITAN